MKQEPDDQQTMCGFSRFVRVVRALVPGELRPQNPPARRAQLIVLTRPLLAPVPPSEDRNPLAWACRPPAPVELDHGAVSAARDTTAPATTVQDYHRFIFTGLGRSHHSLIQYRRNQGFHHQGGSALRVSRIDPPAMRLAAC